MILSLLFLAAQHMVYAAPTLALTSIPALTRASRVLKTTSSCDELDKRLQECARKCFTSANLSVGLSTCNTGGLETSFAFCFFRIVSHRHFFRKQVSLSQLATKNLLKSATCFQKTFQRKMMSHAIISRKQVSLSQLE